MFLLVRKRVVLVTGIRGLGVSVHTQKDFGLQGGLGNSRALQGWWWWTLHSQGDGCMKESKKIGMRTFWGNVYSRKIKMGRQEEAGMGGRGTGEGGFGMIRYNVNMKSLPAHGGQGFLSPVLMMIHSSFLKEEKQGNKK